MPDAHSRLSQIETLWTAVLRTDDTPSQGVVDVRRRLLDRYGPAIQRYVAACLPDEEAAHEVYQEFALRLSRGDFANASPERGRFRDYVKRSVHNLLMDHHRRRSRERHESLHVDVVQASRLESEETLIVNRREHLLNRSWQRLMTVESQVEHPYYAVLRLRVDEPELSSAEMAVRLSESLGRSMTEATVRVLLHRARQHFANGLIDEVRESIAAPGWSDVEDELLKLGLLEYCRSTLVRRRQVSECHHRASGEELE